MTERHDLETHGDHDHPVDRTPASGYALDEVEVMDSGRRWYDMDIAGRINSVLFAFLFALEGLLATRFLLVLFGANRESGFVDFILDLSWPFVRPFDGAFNDRTWEEGIIEVSTLLAMLVWAVAFGALAMLISALAPRPGDTTMGGGDGMVRRRSVRRTSH